MWAAVKGSAKRCGQKVGSHAGASCGAQSTLGLTRSESLTGVQAGGGGGISSRSTGLTRSHPVGLLRSLVRSAVGFASLLDRAPPVSSGLIRSLVRSRLRRVWDAGRRVHSEGTCHDDQERSKGRSKRRSRGGQRGGQKGRSKGAVKRGGQTSAEGGRWPKRAAIRSPRTPV